jgi:hypothetical protein
MKPSALQMDLILLIISKLFYGWIRKGARKEVRSNTGRQQINLSATVDVIGKKVLFRKEIQRYLEMKQNEEKIIWCTIYTIQISSWPIAYVHVQFLVLSQFYVFKSYLETAKTEAHYLPVYSLDLIPIERLWKSIDRKVLYTNEFFDDFKTGSSCFFNEPF